jgi:replicative DNA helicase
MASNQITTQSSSQANARKSLSLASALPPSDIEAEKSLLGSILLNKKILDEVADSIKADYFYEPRNRAVYSACVSLWSSGEPIDVLSVLNKLETGFATMETSVAVESIDKTFLVDLATNSSLSSSPLHLAKILKEKHTFRTVLELSDILKIEALNPKKTADDILDIAQKKLYEVSLNNLEKNFVPIQDILTATFDRINEAHTNKSTIDGVPTGFVDLDKILGGLHKSDLIILAARPSMGKTSLALELVKRMAVQQKTGVAFFSLEMSKDQLVDKMLSSCSGVDLRKIRTGQLSDDPHNNEFIQLGNAISMLSEAPIWIEDSGGLNLIELRTKARRLKSRHNLGLIVIDYLQLMSGKGSDYGGNRVQEVSDISRGLKMLAKELDIPVIALSQLSRSVEGRDDKRPMLSDLRESGSIEQDADIVMFVHREEMYQKETKRKGIADILISKHRNGETGTIELAWVGRLATFDNLQGARLSTKINA